MDIEGLISRFLSRPYVTVTALMVFLVLAGLGATQLQKSTSADELVGMDNPARQYKARVAELFHLRDPLVVAVVSDEPEGIYEAPALQFVDVVSDRLMGLANVDPDRVISVSTEQVILADASGMEVLDLRADYPNLKKHILNTPPFQGSLIGRQGDIALVVAHLLDERQAGATYQDTMKALAALTVPDGLQLHVAGDGAVSGYLSAYIDADTERLVPFVLMVMIGVLWLTFRNCFRRAVGVLAPLIVVVGTLLVTVSAMALSGSPFYVISVGLVVNLVGIAVADSIHILHTLRLTSGDDWRSRIESTLQTLWRPLGLTTLTTATGFLALGLTADMAPMRDFGLFGALGVIVAWCLSITLLPALLLLSGSPNSVQKYSRQNLAPLSQFVARWSSAILSTAVILCTLGVVATTRIDVDDAWIDNFATGDPIHQADVTINQSTNGVNFLDIYIETPELDGLLEPAVLAKLEALEHYAVSLPRIHGAVSVVGLLKEMHQAMLGGALEDERLPDSAEAAAQLLLLYGMAGNPTDLDEEIDYDYQRALVRLSMDSSRYSTNQPVIDALQTYLQTQFNDATVTGTLTGRVMVDYAWSSRIAPTHTVSVTAALLAVLAICCLVFRSVRKGALAMLPVVMAVLFVYLTMWSLDIYLGMGTAMFAAIAIGLGVDFAIHVLARLEREDLDAGHMLAAITTLYKETGHALFVNTAVVALGFGVLAFSKVPPLGTFGMLITIGMLGAFTASVIVLPALLMVLRRKGVSVQAESAS